MYTSPIYFISGNTHKVKELSNIFPEIQQLDIDLPEIQSMDSQEIIEAKLKVAEVHTDQLFFVEDTGLFCDCLGGLPGPLIKFFLQSMGSQGIAEMIQKYPEHRAVARTMIGLGKRGQEPVYFEGTVEGKIVLPRGDSAFGWDPIFEESTTSKTYAEMTFEEKQQISHRAMAVKKLAEYLSR